MPHAVDLFAWRHRFPMCLHTHARPQASLNVATAGGVVIYELLRKYRRLSEINMPTAP